MEKIERLLESQRKAFIEMYDDIVGALNLSLPDITTIKGRLCVLDNKIEDINVLSKELIDFLLDNPETQENAIQHEIRKSDDLNSKYNRLKFQVEEVCAKFSAQSVCGSHSRYYSTCKSNLKLPRIEFTKYGGDLKEWIHFWSQFKRIHEDDNIPKEDKFQYLLQATIPKSRARQLIESYPPSAKNYDKVITNLKTRFGNDELLIEFYVRELLKLVLNNLREKTSLSTLYDRLESQLQSLETLGVTSDKYAAMLFPLVESCLPEELLRVWQRSQSNTEFDSTSNNISNSTDLRLNKLMLFLKKEVEGEEKISLATSSFDIKSKKSIMRQNISVPTAAELINYQKNFKCVFCKGDHKNVDCSEIKEKSLEEKKQILSTAGCCHLCLKYGHIARRCRVRLHCSHCKKSHVTLMCPEQAGKKETIINSLKAPENVESLSNNTYHHIFLQTIMVKLQNGTSSRNIRCIIDTGSQRSYINKFLASEMKLQPLGQETLMHALFGGQSEVVTHNVYKIRLDSLDNRYACNFQVLDQPIICSNINSIPRGPWIDELADLGIKLFDIKDAPIDVLIGADIAGKLFTGKKYNLPSGLVAMETQLGWTLLGKISNALLNTSTSTSLNVITSLLCKNDQISNLWNLDLIGISDPGDKQSKKELEKAVIQHFYDTVKIDDGRYEVALPWIEGHAPIPSNFFLAKRRLDNLIVKLKKDGYYDEYNKVLCEWLAEKIIEVVPRGEELKENVHYLPHRHVVKLDSVTTKVRPVFDASAREKGSPSINQCLETGINLLELIPSFLLKFRLFRIGVIADIKRAFLQIGISEGDRDFLRFLWYDKEGNLIYFRHARVVFGVTCSPFHLNAVIQLHLNRILVDCHEGKSQYSSSVIDKLRKSFYVDNCVSSVDSEDELREFIEQSTKVMSEAKFDLRLWESTVVDNNLDTFVSKVLGLKWNRLEDTLEICFDWFTTVDLKQISKRTILSFANKVFDPLGFLCPVILVIKSLLQKLWSLKIGWDSEVPVDIKKTFVEWVKSFSVLVNFKIPRDLSYPLSTVLANTSKSIHLFTDASQTSYAAVVFLRTEDINGCAVQLIQSKSRLASVRNKMSIPRLELLAATIGARLLSSVLFTLEFEGPIYCWSDSSTVLAWIRREDQWKPFVGNRVQEIQSLTQKEDWLYIPGRLNPADLPSRGCSSKQLLQSRWWEGPVWLRQEKQFWPSEHYEVDEQRVSEEKINRSITSCINFHRDFSWYYRYFSKYSQIVNLVGWIYRFVNNCRRKENFVGRVLSLDEVKNAEIVVLKLVQQEAFTDIYDKSFSSFIPFKDEDGLLRLRTKISERNDSFDFRHPVILPSRHPVVCRLIFKTHVDHCHMGVQVLLSQMRENYWILKGRRTIKSVVSKCVRCRRYDSKRCETDPISLPENRVKDVAVFEIIGVDMAGPLFIKSGEKVWICIFTCAVYRAVYLELVPSLSTESFLQAFRKFISRRGRPNIVYSDNGTNFVGVENAFKRIDFDKILEYSTAQRIRWIFSPLTAAWWGGWWERLIRLLLKQLLRKTLGTTSLSFDELCTILYECEAVMNSRPLTYISDDVKDLVPLTPQMFLQEIKETGTPDIDKIETQSLNKHLQYRVKLKTDFKRRFRKEYLGQLVLRNKRCSPQNIKIGDVVLIGNDGIKRMDWPLGMVIETFVGKDGNIRVVRLKTSSGFMIRPIKRLYPLEVRSDIERNDFRKDLEQKSVKENMVKDKDKEKNKETIDHPSNVKFSRYGRPLKAPERFQLPD